MPDTQWPRFQVFVQEKAGGPYVDAGSVHSPDAELALLNARDVFVRRPECHGLWVAPEEKLLKLTAEQLHSTPPFTDDPNSTPGTDMFYIFTKTRQNGTMTLAGAVQAGSSSAALLCALAQPAGETQPLVWWVLPARWVTANDPADADSLFAPAHDKPFRLSAEFKTVTAMRQIMDVRHAPDAETDSNG